MTDLQLLIPTKIIRSKRRSISLIINDNADFIIRAPLKAKDNDILKFIQQKSNWIIKKRREQLANKITPITFKSGDKINLLGNYYNLICINAKMVRIDENNIIIPIEKPKEQLIKFLKKEAQKYFTERTKYLADLFGFEVVSISIGSAKTCWGSCSFTNRIHFTYKLSLCPIDVIDYVIIHELCHTKFKNHSHEFWNLIKKCYPNYKTCELWLKKNRAIMNLI